MYHFLSLLLTHFSFLEIIFLHLHIRADLAHTLGCLNALVICALLGLMRVPHHLRWSSTLIKAEASVAAIFLTFVIVTLYKEHRKYQ